MAEQMTDDTVHEQNPTSGTDTTEMPQASVADGAAETPEATLPPTPDSPASETPTDDAAEAAPAEESLTEKLVEAVHEVVERAGEALSATKERIADLVEGGETHEAEQTTDDATDEAPAPAEASAETSEEAEASAEATEAAPASTEASDESAEEGEGRKRKRGGKKSGGRKGRKLDSFQPGEELQGTVRSVQPYGAFIDVGAERDGLVHISELRDGFVEKVEDVVKEGQQVTVRVKEVDVEKGRLSLTMRSGAAVAADKERDQEKEKRLRLRDLSEGQELTGRVNSVVEFGAFIDIGATTDGLVHISEMSEERVNRVSDILQEGQEVKVRVLSVDKKRNRISLTMREQVAQEELVYEDEDAETPPSAMELAFARAKERNNKRNKRDKREGRQYEDEMDDVIARTLKQRPS